MYKLEDKEYDFKRVIVQDALKVKSAIMTMADKNSGFSEKEHCENVINDIAIKYLKIKVNNEWVENITFDYLEKCFENEFAVIEIMAQFQKRISGLMGKLPSFQQSKAKQK